MFKKYRENYNFVKMTKITDEVVKDKPLQSYNMELNTKMAFPEKVFKLFKEDNQEMLELYHNTHENNAPHKDTIYLHIKPKIERVFAYRLVDILKQHKK
jgi:hypothetical protein